MVTLNLIELLEAELALMEQDARDRSAQAARNPQAPFRESILCINRWFVPGDPRPCSDCLLIDFVPDEHKSDNVPCHSIPLNGMGDTVKSLLQEGHRERLKEAVTEWLYHTILQLQEERADSEQERTVSVGAA